MSVARCKCEEWATGVLDLNIVRHAEDDRVLQLNAREVPSRFAVSRRFTDRLNAAVPGAADWNGSRMVLRANRHEYLYSFVGVCENCDLIMLQRV